MAKVSQSKTVSTTRSNTKVRITPKKQLASPASSSKAKQPSATKKSTQAATSKKPVEKGEVFTCPTCGNKIRK